MRLLDWRRWRSWSPADTYVLGLGQPITLSRLDQPVLVVCRFVKNDMFYLPDYRLW